MLAGRPCEDREATIHRSYQRNAVRLILHELRRRKVPRTAEFQRVNDRGHAVNDRFCDNYLLDLCAAVTTANLRAERQQLILIADQRRPVDRSQTRNRINCINESLLPCWQALLNWVSSH